MLGYSAPIAGVFSLAELQDHFYSLPDQPDAIPYVTSYYKERCGSSHASPARGTVTGRLSNKNRQRTKGRQLDYAELRIPGQTNREIFLSTYHLPSINGE